MNLINKDDILEIYTDGASRINPGPSAWAFIFVKEGNIFYQNCGHLGEATNNIAEYKAIINALKEAQKYTGGKIRIYSDSELAIRQINKNYRINKKHLSELCEEIYSLCQKFEKVEFLHVHRENMHIKKCDELCNKCLNNEDFGES